MARTALAAALARAIALAGLLLVLAAALCAVVASSGQWERRALLWRPAPPRPAAAPAAAAGGPPASAPEHARRIQGDCARFAVPPPPPLPAATAAAGAAALALVRDAGTIAAVADAGALQFLRGLTRQERERVAYDAHSVVLYLGDEVGELQAAEEAAALAAAPLPDLAALNGVNVGAGGRPVHETLVLVDAHRGLGAEAQTLPKVQTAPQSTLMAWAEQLPFAPASLDYIVSLHNLEHLGDPVAAVLHWLSLLKPGGGLGVVIPHWQYAWRAHKDNSSWGHRWNTAPEVVCELHARHWSGIADLEALNSYPQYRLSFELVLRKKGAFVPFGQTAPRARTGAQLHADGEFVGPVARRLLAAPRAAARRAAGGLACLLTPRQAA
ncbi:hypothetical protein Rsub_00703 [Raphidocelis subcapitata]|uniref:Methyltransferase type 11 domain-containing protein n=1 Tax=Raphidocelis subcapitata TaxID=307507 RepID=A0A2V0NKV5_9CHLO|nr:hypothetical protein Rsub_00703 [Raphidocelis subcapitata]|eukprot:GBF87991.1 hypothetical protein Rsub_00703 [Raphidocelis subcapitata]